MKIEIEMMYPLGTKFYGVKSQTKKLYAPCPTCGNTRKVKAIGIDQSEYFFDCYRCSGKVTKGDPEKSIVIHTFSVVEKTISQLSYTKNGPAVYYSTEFSSSTIPLKAFEDSVKNTNNIFDYCHLSCGEYKCNISQNDISADLSHITALVDAANKAERDKARAFEKEHKLV